VGRLHPSRCNYQVKPKLKNISRTKYEIKKGDYMRKDKAIFMGRDKKTKGPKRPWQDKYQCIKCGHWNLVSKVRCDHCGYREDVK